LLESWMETWDTEAIHQEAKFYCASTDSVYSSPKAETWEQKDITLYTLERRLQKPKQRFNPYMVACYSIGNFTPSAMWPSSHLDSLSFISLLCYPFCTATLPGHRLACFFFWPSFLLQNVFILTSDFSYRHEVSIVQVCLSTNVHEHIFAQYFSKSHLHALQIYC
jgi:hypothetical protein